MQNNVNDLLLARASSMRNNTQTKNNTITGVSKKKIMLTKLYGNIYRRMRYRAIKTFIFTDITIYDFCILQVSIDLLVVISITCNKFSSRDKLYRYKCFAPLVQGLKLLA